MVVRSVRFVFLFAVFLLVSSCLDANNNPRVGELFGYRLGDVYTPRDETTKGYYGTLVDERDNSFDFQRVEIVFTQKTHVIGFIRGISEFDSLSNAESFAIIVSNQFATSYGGSSVTRLDVKKAMEEQTIVTSDGTRIFPIVTYRNEFTDKYSLSVRLFPEKQNGQHFVMIEYGFLDGSPSKSEWLELDINESDSKAKLNRISKDLIEKFGRGQ